MQLLGVITYEVLFVPLLNSHCTFYRAEVHSNRLKHLDALRQLQ